jgi:hypothetical protein
VALLRGDAGAARSALREAARACLASGNQSAGLSLLPPARQAFADDPGAASWGPETLGRTMAVIAAGLNAG